MQPSHCKEMVHGEPSEPSCTCSRRTTKHCPCTPAQLAVPDRAGFIPSAVRNGRVLKLSRTLSGITAPPSMRSRSVLPPFHARQRPVRCRQISGRNATLSNALCAFASAEKILWPSVRKCFPGRSFATCAGVAFLHVVDRSSTLFQQYLVYFSTADHHELWHSTSCSARGCGSHS